MRGRLALLLLLAAPSDARAQTPAATPQTQVLLVAAGNAEVPSARFAKHLATELARRGQTLVSDADATALVGRPIGEAVIDCSTSNDDFCFVALGQVVRATLVITGTATISTTDPSRYEILFRTFEVKSGRTRTPMSLTELATDQGLARAAAAAAETIAPRPRLTAVPTPTPIVALPTPTPPAPVATPVPTPTAVTAAGAGTPEPETEPTPAVAPRGARPLARRPAFWGLAGAGVLALGLAAFFGASALEPEPRQKEGTTTMEVRF